MSKLFNPDPKKYREAIVYLDVFEGHLLGVKFPFTCLLPTHPVSRNNGRPTPVFSKEVLEKIISINDSLMEHMRTEHPNRVVNVPEMRFQGDTIKVTDRSQEPPMIYNFHPDENGLYDVAELSWAWNEISPEVIMNRGERALERAQTNTSPSHSDSI